MSYRTSLLVVALLLFSSPPFLLSPLFLAVRADASVMRVPSDFPTIQAAIDAAPQGTMILVNDGIYFENLHVNKTISLVGADRENTIINGFLKDTVIVVASDNVSISGFTITNSSYYTGGILLDHCDGCTVSDSIMTLNEAWGMTLDHSDNNIVVDNIFSRNGALIYFGTGISLVASSNNTMRDNIVTNSTAFGITLEQESQNNTICGNTIIENDFALELSPTCPNNTIFHNNIIEFGTSPIAGEFFNNSQWSWQGKGNYWKDYTGLDDGSNGRTGGDGIGDTDLPWHYDNYPLTTPVNPIRILWNNKAYPTSLVSNSTVSAFTFDQANKKISFVATGAANTTGYFNASMPKTVLSGSWRIVLNQTDATSKSVIVENQTYTTIFLNYNHSSQNIELIGTQVILEYPSPSSFLLAILLLSTAAVIFVKKRPCARTETPQEA